MSPKIANITKEQMFRAEEKAWEMYEWMTRILVATCRSDTSSADETDPDVFDDGFALLNYITVGGGKR